MSRRQNPPMPATAFGLLLVEGGDELAVCQIMAGQTWSSLCGWKADSRDLPNLARLARNDPNFRFARSVGVVLDVENDLTAAQNLANDTLAALGATGRAMHGVLTGSSA
jgi:hypothetical protein